MGTWSRKGLKEKAKIRLKANYWKAVLVGLLAVLIGGGGSAGIRSIIWCTIEFDRCDWGFDCE